MMSHIIWGHEGKIYPKMFASCSILVPLSLQRQRMLGTGHYYNKQSVISTDLQAERMSTYIDIGHIVHLKITGYVRAMGLSLVRSPCDVVAAFRPLAGWPLVNRVFHRRQLHEPGVQWCVRCAIAWESVGEGCCVAVQLVQVVVVIVVISKNRTSQGGEDGEVMFVHV